jgi:nucleotide-binding universal stress UspA family protein
MGSFSESLLARSSIPVLTINATSKIPGEFQSILLPTEFSKHSEPVFQQIVSMAREFRSKLYLLYITPLPPQKSMLSASARIPAEVEDRLLAWRDYAGEHGVFSHYSILTMIGSIPQTILEYAKKHTVDLIAMESESGRIQTALLGSVAQALLRNAECPVWCIKGRMAHVEELRKTA